MDDLIAEFITETGESLSMLDSELVKLEQNPDDMETLGNIFRLVHTIKGTCGFLGLPRLATVAHAGENVLGKVRERQITVSSISISMILESLDRIKNIMDYLAANGNEPEGSDEDLCRRLNVFADSNGAIAEKEGGQMMDTGMEAPAIMVATSASAEEMEAAFAAPTPQAAHTEAEPAPPAPAPAPKPAPIAQELPEAVKQEALKQGANAPATNNAASEANQSIRVNLSVLENLMQMVGELVLTRNQLLQLARIHDNDAFNTPLQHLSHITTELQEGVMKTRMQPISNAWAKFPRLIRDLSMELGKKIDLKMIGSETELDRQLLEMIKDPLTHMVRNSCDHGLEGPEDRIKAGKNPMGEVKLSAYHEGGHIIIEIADDGRGVNLARVKQKILENNLATPEELATMAESQITQYIFKAGFSTAEKVTSVSGRGVGMDVVRTNIEKIGGTVELHSVAGKGSTFHIKIPLTLAIVSVLIVDSGGQRFALPQINVLEMVKTGDESGNKMEMINRSPVLRLRGKLLPLISLAYTLRIDEGKPINCEDESFVVVCRVGGSEFGLIVDGIHDTEEIVVKPVSSCLQNIPIYSGNTVLGDGGVIMILDPNGLSKTTETELESQTPQRSDASMPLNTDKLINFLLFKTEGKTPKAVALELVSRLEDIKVENIEYSNGEPVVQYRGELMSLSTLPDQTIPEEGLCEVIVFNYDGKVVGLVVSEILDIVLAEAEVKRTSRDPNYLGTIVIKGASTDILDVGYLLSNALGCDINFRDLTNGATRMPRVLLVEDSMFFRNLTVPFLAEVGLEVTAVPSGRDALLVLGKQEFDVIVTDIEMPLMDGFELSQAIRAKPEFNAIPIFAYTSTTNQTIEDKVNQCGMNGYVMKTEREKLIHKIMSAVNPETADNYH
ncbi:MAG: hybrid sensor histidine kinase/response regulator [Alphaproteobacteria bacterium]|nr:MAG: hybrid sensor histidine kinase/response regulator [Alphaproteobacteria bacterium]